ncbi:transport inhibitor response 1-like protein Os05g0150500 [Phalaenopsis equestris]|uniref:transport inhibitor response 1-like protein Os05g0150500 n=1 Tax=Phalaenopsis equestris TaxID=78828 RepID=UPI0009E512C4|nr:transport inhibitor response 1-like protein Os05g0150500 [Phalaenopsis equestris]
MAAAAMFPDEVWEYVFSFVEGDVDRNAISLVCRGWYGIERRCRRRIFVGNCYAVSPEMVFRRFPEVRAVSIKGKPHFADFNLVPSGWGGGAGLWVEALVEACPQLEELRLKRMVVADDCLELIGRYFRNFKVLSLTSCEGFSTAGLASVARNCRNLRELDLQENAIADNCSNWLSHFPESFTSLTSLNISCLDGDVNLLVLERLVSRCSNLKTLRLNNMVPLDRLVSILVKVPQLVDLGTGRFSADSRPDLLTKLESLFAGCKNLKSLSGLYEAVPAYLPTIFSVCDGLSSLNLSYATMPSAELAKLITRCKNLERLWVMDLIEDVGLEAVASSCKLLKELRVFPFDPYGAEHYSLTERGLMSVSAGCPMLRSVLYFCQQMTNVALITVAMNSPNLTSFRLCIMDPHTPDYLTRQPLDAGFSAIVEACKDLRRLSVSGRLTDRVFKSIGAHADRVKMLSVAFAGDSDAGLHYILSGCKSLKKLEIRDCPFGDEALLANTAKLETMRSLWMSSCSVSLGACRLLAKRMPRLNVEVIDERRGGQMELRPDDCPVEKLYIYRTVAGPRSDTPSCVWTI